VVDAPVTVVAEFTIEPFVEGSPGPHVEAGLDAVRAAGFDPVIGPFGSSVTGPVEAVTEAVKALLDAATAAGATRVSIQVSRADAPTRSTS
jgi:uncharacterized protein YqgV (UPF0045/DUF77 family)